MKGQRHFFKAIALTLGLAFVGQPIAAQAGDGFMLATGRVTGKSFAVGSRNFLTGQGEAYAVA